MKLTRDQLKAMIKECIVEVLSEGIGGTVLRTKLSELLSPGKAASTRPQQQRNHRPAFDSRLDTPVNQPPRQNPAIAAAIKSSAGGNSIMEEIFAHTAATTLQDQAAHGDSSAQPAASSESASSRLVMQEQINGTPEQVFGEESASRWADLAFMGAPAKKTA